MKALIPVALLVTMVGSACKPKMEMPSPTLAERTPPAEADMPQPENFVGLTLEQAKKNAESAGVRWRVIEEDRISKPVTRDYDPARLNFVLEKGVLTKVSLG